MKIKKLNDLKMLDAKALQKEADLAVIERYKLKAEYSSGKTKKPNTLRGMKLYRARIMTLLRQRQIIESEEANLKKNGKSKDKSV